MHFASITNRNLIPVEKEYLIPNSELYLQKLSSSLNLMFIFILLNKRIYRTK